MDYSADILRRSLGKEQAPVVLDVRSKAEYRSAHIPGALHLPFWLLPFKVRSLAVHRERELVVCCEHGPRAVLARQILQSKGFEHVTCLTGHMHGWRRAGYPVERD